MNNTAPGEPAEDDAAVDRFLTWCAELAEQAEHDRQMDEDPERASREE